MKCISPKYHTLHPEDPSQFYNFKKFESVPTFSNYNLVSVGSDLKLFEEYDNVVYMHYEEPNCFSIPSQERNLKANYHKIKRLISSCPFSVEYYNNLYNDDRRIYGFFPFNAENIPSDFTKKYDVFFSGHVMPDNRLVSDYVNVIEKFNNCVVAFNYGRFRGATYREKLQLNANSKISVVHNCLQLTGNGLILDEMYPGHKLFGEVKTYPYIPQPKGRTLEAAACRSIILCHYEKFKCVEWYFEPDKDFIYWYDLKDLEEKIHEILKNYDKYTYLTENAFNKLVNNWTTEHYFDKYLRNL